MIMGKSAICAVPFSAEDIPVIVNLTNFMPEYVVDFVVAPGGLGLEGKDIGAAENRCELGYTVTSNLNDSIKSCDTVLILSKDKSGHLYDYGIKAVEEAIRQRKDIICLLDLDRETMNRYKEICHEENIGFRCILEDELPRVSYRDISEPLYHPYAPVVFIGELAENVQGYEVFYNLVKLCQDKGLRVSAIGPERANGLFGFHTIDFSDMRGELGSRVYRVNKYVRNIEEQENPGIIIIKLPKPMMKFDEDVRYDFGLSAYMVSQAVPASFFIACSPYGFFSEKFWEPMSGSFQAKFGYEIDAVHISNKMIDSTDEMDKNKLCFVHMSGRKVQEVIEEVSDESSFILGNLTEPKYMERVFKEIENSLIHVPYGLIV